ncbi:FHA domain-containing protein [Nonomuraea endophytica]|uniref:S-DNA-T family DNA segregation ATPase FtsK/SpoIIIE n=1 Tax=Nonomuraea endophytica TaxID=714136 RepID=A0A7W8A9E1_9ACTN|nr:FHA domain-containing protein [Nonomuraea endophytica]MBB5080658.1 S-DNA-T family DNA segregation ATPase FtsK/SpoIIIE [Nonomuraea endophytica]
MIIRLTVRDPELAAAHDLEVAAEPGTKLATLLGALPPRPCYAGSAKLDPEATFADGPLVSGMVLGVGEPARDERARPAGTTGGLRVVGGPDAGRLVWLAPGAHVVGRDHDAAVRLVRDHRVSRLHVRLEVSVTGELTVTDLGSTNGTLVGGEPVSGSVRLPPGEILQVGDDLLRWVPLPAARPHAVRGSDGMIAFDRGLARREAGTPSDQVPDELDLTLAALREGPGLWSRDAASPDGLVLRVGVTGEPAVPAVVDLREAGVLGVVGPRPPVDGLVRWLLVQLATLRAPAELRLVILAEEGGEHLAWTRWLPHLRGGERVPCLIGTTEETRAERVAELLALIADPPEGEEVVVLLDGARSLRELPGLREVLRDGPAAGVYTICADRRGMSECLAVCELDGTDLLLTRAGDGLPAPIRPEYVDAEAAERIARALAPLRDRAEPDTPARLLDLLGMETPAVRWPDAPVTKVVVGTAVSGTVSVDVAADSRLRLGGAGPDLARALVAALLLANPPDALALVLVGESLRPFAPCPHVTGWFPAWETRMGTALNAEAQRRTALLAAHADLPPRLVVIAEEEHAPPQPVESAQLGMHLVLVTALTSRSRGLGMIMRTGGEPRLFRTAGLGHPPPSWGAPARVRVVSWAELGDPRPADPPVAMPTDLESTVAEIVSAAERRGARPPFRPIPPPLPDVLHDPVRLPPTFPYAAPYGRIPPLAAPYGLTPEVRKGLLVPYGLADDPAHQAQPVAALDLRGTDRLLVAGRTGSGRTTFARTLISALTRHPAWIYAIEDKPGELAAYTTHCGAVVSPGEPDRIRRVFTWLAGEAERRLAAGPGDPLIVLVVDGWERFERPDARSLMRILRRLVTRGPSVGIHTVAAGRRDNVLFSRRLLLGHGPPGRAADAATGQAVQIAVPAEPRTPLTAARPFPPMPGSVEPGELGRVTGLAIGMGGQDVTTIGLDPLGAGPHAVLVSGPPGSGRSAAALLIAGALLERGVDVLVIAPPGSPVAALAGARVLTGTAFSDEELRAAVAGRQRFAVVVDDFEQVAVTAADRPTLLDEAASSLGAHVLVLAGDATQILEGRPHPLAAVVTEVFRSGARVVLNPRDRAAALIHGLVLENDEHVSGPPGRGYLSVSGRTVLVQLARGSRA